VGGVQCRDKGHRGVSWATKKALTYYGGGKTEGKQKNNEKLGKKGGGGTKLRSSRWSCKGGKGGYARKKKKLPRGERLWGWGGRGCGGVARKKITHGLRTGQKKTGGGEKYLWQKKTIFCRERPPIHLERGEKRVCKKKGSLSEGPRRVAVGGQHLPKKGVYVGEETRHKKDGGEELKKKKKKKKKNKKEGGKRVP